MRKVKENKKIYSIFPIILTCFLVFFCSACIYLLFKPTSFLSLQQNPSSASIPTPTSLPVISPSQPGELVAINSAGPFPYETFRFDYPDYYQLSTGKDFYKATTGKEPPKDPVEPWPNVILTKISLNQFIRSTPCTSSKTCSSLGKYTMSSNDCIMIAEQYLAKDANFGKFESIIYGTNYNTGYLRGNFAPPVNNIPQVISSSQYKIWQYNGEVREVASNLYPTHMEAFVAVPPSGPNKAYTAYFFTTCNLHNTQDLYKVLENFHIRDLR